MVCSGPRFETEAFSCIVVCFPLHVFKIKKEKANAETRRAQRLAEIGLVQLRFAFGKNAKTPPPISQAASNDAFQTARHDALLKRIFSEQIVARVLVDGRGEVFSTADAA